MKKFLLLLISSVTLSNVFAQSTALHFDGTDDYVQIKGHKDLCGPKKITLETWIWVDNFNSSPCASCAPLIWQKDDIYRFGTGNSKELHFDISDGSNTNSLVISKAVLKDTTWHHLAGTYDGRYLRIYLDGQILDSTQTKISALSYPSTSTDVWVGDPQTGYGGIIEETRIWDYARSLKEIQEGMVTTYPSNEPGLLLQLSYEDGTPYQNNSKISTVKDGSSLGNDGTIGNLTLTGKTSNFVIGRSYCDSTVYGKDKVTACDFYRLPSGKRSVNVSGKYLDTIYSKGGCDSVITIEVTILKSTSASIKRVACDSFRSLADKNLWYRKSGKYQERLKNYLGCDSLVNLELTITRPSKEKITYKECNSVSLKGSGKLISKSGVYGDTLTAWAGCDSIILHDVTILYPSYSKKTLDFCRFVVSPSDKNTTYKQEGIYYDTIMNSVGCDSVITYTVVSARTYGETDITACESYKAPSGSRVYTESGKYIDTLYGANSKFCDSFLTINLTLIKPITEKLDVTGCGEYITPSGRRITQSGPTTDLLKSSLGCDSINYVINVDIININPKVSRDWNTLIADAKDDAGTTFQWLDCNDNYAVIEGANSAFYDASGNGQFAVEITQGKCIDTSRCQVFAYTSKKELSEMGVRLYPNPSNQYWMLTVDEPMNDVEIMIVDLSGKQVWGKSLSTLSMYKIEADLTTGVYTLIVSGSNRQFKYPLISN